MEAAAGLAAPLLSLDVGPLAELPRSDIPKPAVTPEQAGLLILPTPVPAPKAPVVAPIDQALLDSLIAIFDDQVSADRFVWGATWVTVGYFVSQSADRPELFTTYERFADRAAMDRHNNSPAVARFVAATKEILAEPFAVHIGTELSAHPH